jgi:hypothetical protein
MGRWVDAGLAPCRACALVRGCGVTGGCSPEHSNHIKLGGNSGPLRACDQKGALPRDI